MPEFSCPHCLRRLDRLDLVPWFELLRCEWSGRSYLKLHDMKWDYAPARLSPPAARAIVDAPEADRDAALARVGIVGEDRITVGAIEDHLRTLVATGALVLRRERAFVYLRRPRAAAWLALPMLAAVVLLLASGIAPLPWPLAAAVAAGGVYVVVRLVARLRRQPFRLTVAGETLEVAVAGKLLVWPIAGVTGGVAAPRTVAGVYRRSGALTLRHGEVAVRVHPDLGGFAELVGLLRAGGAAIADA